MLDMLHLHPTMYLLIRQGQLYLLYMLYNLHPTMYLLIPCMVTQCRQPEKIYIPLCIY